jgi:hypothetical protein
MVESSEPPVEAAGETPVPASAEHSSSQRQYEAPNRLNLTLTWVGIVAGVLFIVAVLCVSGFAISATFGDHRGGHHGYGFHSSAESVGSCPMMTHDGMMGPEHMGPGHMGPVQPSPTSPERTTPGP